MNKTNQALLTILLFVILGGGGYLFLQTKNAIPKIPTIPTIPTADLSTRIPDPNTVDYSATQMAEANQPVPTMELRYIKNEDLEGLRAWLISQEQNGIKESVNIHWNDTSGVGNSSITIYNKACDAIWPANQLCLSATIEFYSVWKGVISGGVSHDFILKPTIDFKRDTSGNIIWQEIKRETKDNVIEVTFGGTVIVTYSGDMCVTSVEENTPSAIHEPVSVPLGGTAPDKDSYTMKTRDETLYKIGNWEYDLQVNEKALEIEAYKKAKIDALRPEKIRTFLGFVHSDLVGPNGYFYQKLDAFWNQQMAFMFGVYDFEVVVAPNPISDDNTMIRCDGSLIGK